ncbi:MAG: hypothetical protein K5848_00400 [Lachnospiraceae bacterium]|nr:hypothetical protein [Lachnospiraceae bacterium]
MKFQVNDKKRLVFVVVSCILMGFCISWLNKCCFGSDSFTTANNGLSNKLGIDFGTYQLMVNIVMLIAVLLIDRTQIGWGTVANMVLVGYSCNFFSWLEAKILPSSVISFDKSLGYYIFDSFTVRIIVVWPVMLLFIIAASCYMSASLGSSPYDALPFVIASRFPKKLFKIIRILYDVAFAVLGFAFGAKVGLVTVVIALALGPVVAWMKESFIDKLLGAPKEAEA